VVSARVASVKLRRGRIVVRLLSNGDHDVESENGRLERKKSHGES
jgi:hypothetical protein